MSVELETKVNIVLPKDMCPKNCLWACKQGRRNRFSITLNRFSYFKGFPKLKMMFLLLSLDLDLQDPCYAQQWSCSEHSLTFPLLPLSTYARSCSVVIQKNNEILTHKD